MPASTRKPNIRIAFREEGAMWNAYIASATGMEGAFLIGSIAIGPCKNNPEIKDRFVELMSKVLEAGAAGLGVKIDGFYMEPAPEHEKSGGA